MAELNPVTVVAASGAAQTLTSDYNTSIDPIYVITLTANCTISLTATSPTIPRRQTITAKLRQDSTGGRVVTLPVLAWANQSVPVLNTKAGGFDELQFWTDDNGANWTGGVVTLGAQVPAKPAAPSITATAGNGQTTIVVTNGASNGSQITSYNLYRGTSAGSETLVGQVTLTNGTYVDTGETNGTAYYFQMTAINGVGESPRSTEVTATPSNSPAHYFSVASTNQNAYSSKSASNTTADGIIDVTDWSALTSYASATGKVLPMTHTWAATSSAANSGWNACMDPTGSPQMLYYSNGTYGSTLATATLASVVPSVPANGVYQRRVLNLSTNTYAPTGANALPVGGSTVSGANSGGTNYSAAPGTCAFFASLDGITWTQVGATKTGLPTTGISSNGYPAVGHNGSSDTAPSGKFYAAIVRNSTGILWNPNFTAQATGATSFADTAPTPNTFTVFGGSIA